MQMCEMSLDETGLTRKRGAEILGKIYVRVCLIFKLNYFLEHEFEKEWAENGGLPYTKHADRKKNERRI